MIENDWGPVPSLGNIPQCADDLGVRTAAMRRLRIAALNRLRTADSTPGVWCSVAGPQATGGTLRRLS